MYKSTNWYKSILFAFFLSLLILSIGLLSSNITAETGLPQTTLEKIPIADTYVASGRPNTAPSAPDLKIFWLGLNQTNGLATERALLKFEISIQEIPIGSTIQSARLLLTLSGTTKNDGPLNVTVNRILSEQWSENLTWNAHEGLPITADTSTTIAVGREFKQYEWNIQKLVQEWAHSPERIDLGLRLDGDQTSGDHERNFWAKDCKDSECNVDQRPRVVIQFEAPTPTPTPTNPPTATPTVTPTPTFIPTALPGVKALLLVAEPTGEIAVTKDLTYTLTYTTNNSGSEALSDVVITDTIPAYTQLVTDTIKASSGFTHTYTGYTPGSVITWTLQRSLLDNERGFVSYQISRTATTTNTVIATGGQAIMDDEEVIYNDGMDMGWIYIEKRSYIRSNSTRNPPYYLYLPIVPKS